MVSDHKYMVCLSPCLLSFPTHLYSLLLVIRLLSTHNRSPDMLAMQADMALLNRLVAASLPELAKHLEAIALPLDLFATQWLVSLFSASLPPQVSLKWSR